MATMATPANSDDDAALRAYADELADAVELALPGWVVREVERVLLAWQDASHPVDPNVLAAAAEAGRVAVAEVGPALRALLADDIDRQRANPLMLLRGAVRYPTAVLRSAGVPPVVRDELDERLFPDDVYGLAPASFADVDAALHEPGIAWGAAKAHVHLARRRAEGRR